MKKSRVLLDVLKTTKTDKIVISFIGFVFLCALGVWIVEPTITSYVDALWFCFTSFTTIGFGDIVVTTLLGKAITVVLCLYGIFVVALIPGVVVSYYTETLKMKTDESLVVFLDKLQRLPELSKEELEEISIKAKQRVKHIKK